MRVGSFTLARIVSFETIGHSFLFPKIWEAGKGNFTVSFDISFHLTYFPVSFLISHD